MRIPGCALALVLSAIGVIPRETQAADFQVLYAEPIALRAEDARSVLAASQAGRPQAISFDAYGRHATASRTRRPTARRQSVEDRVHQHVVNHLRRDLDEQHASIDDDPLVAIAHRRQAPRQVAR